MTFIEFCQAHGIIIDKPPRLGHWERYPTESHPKKRNGAVKWMGEYGFCQDHAVHVDVLVWQVAKNQKLDVKVVSSVIKQAEEDRRKLQENAATRAAMILNRTVTGRHDYLRQKGFPDEKGLIWCHDQTEHLVIPMYDDAEKLVGMQTIDASGQKKFLYGQKTSGANFVIGRQGQNVLCEGYATGLSIRAAMQALKQLWKIHVCFSANNLVTISRRLGSGFVVADNDESGTGERVAKQTGFRYWISEKKGEDFNDTHRRTGLFQAAKSLWQSMHGSRIDKGRDSDTFAGALETHKVRK